MVEDAVLTIEAIPIVETTTTTDEDQTNGESSTEENTKTTDDAASTSSAKSAAAPTAAPKKKAGPHKRETVGDRVLADNPLARAISAIPHLFLRDIRVRLIIRDDEPPVTKPKQKGEEPPTQASNQPNPNDTMLEFGIEFLSVTSGEDVLSHFQKEQQQEDESSQNLDETNESGHLKPPLMNVPSYSSMDNTSLDQNEYLVRHIRTGRGPSAGISLQVFTHGPKLPARLQNNMDPDIQWARQQWVMATDFHLLRCSGVDIRARIHLGTRKEVATYSWFYDYEEDTNPEESTWDSMLFGLETVAPGPQPSLPPPINNLHMMSRGDTPGNQDSQEIDEPNFERFPGLYPGSDVYFKDKNEIQSCKVPSSFHRISRGMLPGSCKECTHLPSEVCSLCWEVPDGVDKESTLDMSMPMPGLALQVTLRDPIEINVDRSSLETLGLLKSLFVKKKTPDPESDEPPSDRKKKGKEADSTASVQASTQDAATHTTASTIGIFAGFLSSRIAEPVKEDPSDAFSTYMQPENIQIVGMHLSEVLLRVHVLREDRADSGLSFCYWDIIAGCLTMDHHSLRSPEKTSQDLKFDVGYLNWDEMRGTGSKQLVSAGLPYTSRRRCDSAASGSTMQSMIEGHDLNRTPWPSTACALMDIPPPLETMIYKDRERHGLQFRFISVNNPAPKDDAARSLINVRVGLSSVVVPWGFWRDINSVRLQMVRVIIGQKNEDLPKVESESDASKKDEKVQEAPPKESMPPPQKSLMTYSVQIDGGNMVMHPVINMNLPLTQFSGERSSESGIFFETMLEKFRFVYGEKEPPNKKGLSLQQVAALPESVRLRILLCLKDLHPLEEALQIKKEVNPFRRTRAVNKGILKMAKKLSKSAKLSKKKQRRDTSGPTPRRQEIMTELMKLDANEMDELWSLHQKHQRKLARKAQESVAAQLK
jgi:hypothetical protein